MSEWGEYIEAAPRRVHLRTYGCQMNEYDSEVMAGLLEREGWSLTADEARADIILFNTCSVRQHAEDRVWNALFSLRERASRDPGLIIGVCGCMAQWRAEEIARRCPHVRLVCGTQAFTRLPELIRKAAASGSAVVDTGADRVPCPAGLPKVRKQKLKAFVPVMRGCGNFCAYCVVPYVRGPEVSRPPEEIIAEVEALARDGCREVMLLGQNVNSYSAEGLAFADLLRIVGAVGGVERIRFMTSHPKDFPDDLIRAMVECMKVCEHLHLPLQSGSDRTLEKMNRKYTYEAYRALVRRIREAVPAIALSTDVMVGFPGETDEDFGRTLRAMEEIRFDSAFMFKYSDRDGTAAARMGPKVPEKEIIRRHAGLLQLQNSVSMEKNRELIGKVVQVLVEGYSPRNPGRLFGRTRTNKRVVFEGAADLIGQLICVSIREATPLTLIGHM